MSKTYFLKNYVCLALLFIFVSSLVFLQGCSKQESNDSTLHVGYFNNITHAQALYMKSQGTLEKAVGDDVTVSWTAFNAGPAEVEALFAGDIDIGYIGPVPAITANVKSKGDITVLSGACKAGAVLVTTPGSEIKKVEDLDGKTVSIPQLGNTQHLCLLKLLEDHGLAPADNGGTVNVPAVENADVQNMMDQKQIDAALVPEPWGSVLEAQGAQVMLDYDQVFAGGDYPVAVVVVREDYLQEHPEIVELFLQEHERITDVINGNSDEAAEIVNKEIEASTGKSIEPDILKKAFGKLILSCEINKQSMVDFADIMKKCEFISEFNEDTLYSR